MNDLIERAMAFAEEAHKGQVRKYNGQPYFTHPARVAKRLENLGFWPEMVAAGYLHAVVEDCGVKIEEIRSLFGDKVADLVLGLTNPSKGLKASRAERKKIDREHLATQTKNVKIIKLVDRIDNIREMNDADTDYHRRGQSAGRRRGHRPVGDPGFVQHRIKLLYAKETLLLIPCLYSSNGLDDPVYYELVHELGKLASDMAGIDLGR